MTTIMPTDKNLRNAIAWVEEHRDERADLASLVNEASLRFNLTPIEEVALTRFYRDQDQDRAR